MDELEDDFEDAYATNAATAPSSGWDDLPTLFRALLSYGILQSGNVTNEARGRRFRSAISDFKFVEKLPSDLRTVIEAAFELVAMTLHNPDKMIKFACTLTDDQVMLLYKGVSELHSKGRALHKYYANLQNESDQFYDLFSTLRRRWINGVTQRRKRANDQKRSMGLVMGEVVSHRPLKRTRSEEEGAGFISPEQGFLIEGSPANSKPTSRRTSKSGTKIITPPIPDSDTAEDIKPAKQRAPWRRMRSPSASSTQDEIGSVPSSWNANHVNSANSLGGYNPMMMLTAALHSNNYPGASSFHPILPKTEHSPYSLSSLISHSQQLHGVLPTGAPVNNNVDADVAMALLAFGTQTAQTAGR